MGTGIVAEAGCRLGAAGAVHWGIGSFLARQDWWPLLRLQRKLVPPSSLKRCHTFSHTREVTPGSDQRNSSCFGSFHWFCYSSLTSWSQLDRQSNSVTCSFGGGLFTFRNETDLTSSRLQCFLADVCEHAPVFSNAIFTFCSSTNNVCWAQAIHFIHSILL